MAITDIDWQRPWLAPLRARAAPLLATPDWCGAASRAAQAQTIANQRGLPIQFVPQQSLPADTAYEAFIDATGQVPTRGNLHDFFNALIWLHFPAIKRSLNALQAAEMALAVLHTSGGAGNRGRQRDAATLFDENAALLVTSDSAIVDALRAHQWKDALLHPRAQFTAHCDVLLFGHALLEKLVKPYKAITAHAWIVRVDPDYFSLTLSERLTFLDVRLAEELAAGFAVSDFTPLPVLGVPHWWPQQDDDFYSDTAVFRARRGVRALSVKPLPE